MESVYKLAQLEETWARGQHTDQTLTDLKAFHAQANDGYDRHRAFCLIELITSPQCLRNDGEIKRLLKHRYARHWMQLLVPLPEPASRLQLNDVA